MPIVLTKKVLPTILFALIIFSIIPQANAVTISHTFVEQTTRQTVTGTTYTNVTGANIASGNFTVGNKYLLVFTGQVDNDIATSDAYVKAVHGSTDFEGSELAFETENAVNRYTYFWFTVWTAISGEPINLQFKHETAGQVTGIDQVTIFAMNLTNSLTENTDWFFSENTTDTTIQSLYADDTGTTSVTFTPNGSDDWLVLSTAHLDPDSVTVEFQTRINATGGVSDSLVEWIQEGEDATADRMVQTLAKVYTPTAVSTTFETETQRASADGGTKLYNSIFALNLNKFAVHSFEAIQAQVDLDVTNNLNTSTNLANTTMTPDNQGDVWSFAFAVHDADTTGSRIKYRTQIDSADQPPTQTSDDYLQLGAWDNLDELPFAIQTVENLTATSHTMGFNATKTGVTRPVEDRLSMMVTMEKASGQFTSNQTETINMTDTVTITLLATRNQTDDIILNDTNSFTGLITHNQTDNINLNDTNSFTGLITHNQTDNINFNDTNSFTGLITHNQTDNIILNDTNSFTALITHNQTDNINLNDTNTFNVDFFMNQTDNINFNDTNTFSAILTHNQTENMILNDTNTFTVTITQSFSDDVSFFDASTSSALITSPPVVGGGGGGGSPPPTVIDSDQDGIPDIDDGCDLQPEDFDGFQDADGCPEGEAVVPPPEGLTIPDIIDQFPFEFNQLDVVDDFITLETDLPQPQVETLSIRWLGAKPITISSIQLGQSPFEIQMQDIPIEFGNNRFGLTETQILYTIQEPDKVCSNQILFDCLDKITYDIPVIVTGELDGKTITAEGSITIDNSDRINPYWLIILGVILIPLIAILFHKHRKHDRELSSEQKLSLTPSNLVFNRAVILKKPVQQKSGTTRSKLNEGSTRLNLSKKDLESKPTKFKSIEDNERRNIFGKKSRK